MSAAGPQTSQIQRRHGERRGSRRHSSAEPRSLRQRWEIFCGFLLCGLTLVTPWLYGTTESWSVRLMNCGCLAAGLCALPSVFRKNPGERAVATVAEKVLKCTFLGVNLLLLGFILTSYLNARATFSMEDRSFTYWENVISWLPTSYDKSRTGQFLINTATFFLIFWSMRAWLLGGTIQPHHRRSSEQGGEAKISAVNGRVKFLLWLLAINGFALTVQGIFQRLTHSDKLLWIRNAYWRDPLACFGPFSYRGTAADYMNLIWPATLGLWIMLSERRRKPGHVISDGPELLLLPMFLVTAAGTFISLSRGASLVAGLMLLALLTVIFVHSRSGFYKLGIVLGLIMIGLFVTNVSQGQLAERFKSIFSDQLGGRTELYHNAKQIIADFPVYGSGPGTFLSVYHLYRESADQEWQGFLHDDWLETLATFGWAGFSIVLLQFALLFGWAFAARARWPSQVLPLCLFIALGGCLLHAKGDFPFQIYSIEFTFVILAAVLTALASPSQPLSPNDRDLLGTDSRLS
jgi:hypothetical protein